MNILLVEDDNNLRQSLTDYLEQLEFVCEPVSRIDIGIE